jgi:membrane fusion protein (multidrug efflux system)
VQGIVERRVFTEGTDVRKGDLLYAIEPIEYQKAVENAKASLARAQADLANAKAKEARLAPLVKEEAISRQDYDDAATTVKQQEAAVASARATLDRAEIDLGYTKVYATESGRIGQTLVPEGRLVGKDGPTQLATIDKIDPAYVVFTLSDRDAMVLRRAIVEGRIKLGGAAGERLRRDIAEGKVGGHDTGAEAVRVVLPDGSDYKQGGRIDFADAQVNPDTGTITLRAVLPNPDRTLLPGMFVRVELNVGTRPDAILLPQRAVVKAPTGHMVWIVNKESKVERRDVVVGPWYRADWVIDKGLGAGELVIVDGVQKVQPGLSVRATAFVEPASAPGSQPTPSKPSAAAATK